MAKKSKSKKTAEQITKRTEKKPLFSLSERKQDFLFLGIITIILIVLLKPLVIDHLQPQGVDVLASIATTHQTSEWQKESGEKALWNPYIFAGMPTYQRGTPVTFSIDTFLGWLGRIFNNIFMYYLFGALGMYLFLRYMKMSPLISFFGAAVFVLMPHYKSLFLEGHNTKLRALMVLPWVVFSFTYFLNKRNLLGAAFFALVFGMQIRTQHYQIVFYSGLLIFAIGIYPVLKDLFDKQYKQFAKSSILIIAAVILAIMSAAQPLFLAKEYLPWSKRGKTTVDISQPHLTKSAKSSDGVSIEYATQWSTAPSEIVTWFIPRFYGGMSREIYNGNAIKQLKGREIPGYWGEMPFTQSYEYLGALALLLAVIGVFYNRKNKLIVSLLLFAGFLTLLSFGRHAEWFYSLFYNYMPFFNKFRAPMMSITVTYFIVVTFSAFGLKALFDLKPEKFDFTKYKPVLIVLVSFIGFGLLVWLIGQSFSFIKTGEAYDAQTTGVLKTIRKELFTNDVLRYLLLTILSSGVIFLYLKKKFSFTALVLVLAFIGIFDLINIQSRNNKTFVDVEKLKNTYFSKTETDRAILEDKSVFRILPLQQNFGDNRWTYFHQSVGGYTPIKMFTIEEIVQNNLQNGAFANRNIMKILNVKYVISAHPLTEPDLQILNINKVQQLYTYLYMGHLTRGFFVDNYTVITDEFDRLKELNNPNFRPEKTAILEVELQEKISAADSSTSTLTIFTPNHVQFKVYTNTSALFVISEMYYPPGWQISIDEKPVDKIYKTDHAIQSIVVPAGEHEINLRFEPESYIRNVSYAMGSLGLVFLVIISSLIQLFLKKKNEKIG